MKKFYFFINTLLILIFNSILLQNNVNAQCDNISISGLDAEYCIIDQESELSGYPYGGTFSGPGVTGNFFDPAAAGEGTHEIKYVFDSIYYEIDQTGTFNPISSPGNVVILDDDEVSSALPLGFTFNFFGVDYTEFYISSNGFITFDSDADDGCCDGQDLPNTDSPNNLIAFAWTDLNPENGGTIKYVTLGTTPNRVCVIDISDLPYYNGGGTVNTQIKLFETTNTIEIHSTDIPTTFDIKTMGVENEDGTLAYAVDGRNSTNWGATNDFVKFTPVYCTGSATQEVIVNDNPAEMSLLISEINYGQVFLDDNISENILISNTGCDTLHIDSLKNSESVYSFINLPFDIMPGETEMITVTFTPTALQMYNDAIQIFTNDIDVSVNVSGEGIASPVMTIDTETIEGTINDCSGTLDFTFNVQNTGANNLEYTINNAIFEDDFEDGDISDWTMLPGINASVDNTIVGNGNSSLHLEGSGEGIMQSFDPSQPNYISIMIYPDLNESGNALFVIGDNNAISNGGILFVYFDDNYFQIANSSQPFIVQESRWYQFEFKNINFDNETFDCYIDGILFEENIPFVNNIDYMSALYLTNFTDASSYFDDIYVELKNSWVEVSPTSGTVSSSGSETISVHFSSDNLNSGTHTTKLFVKSNDPANPSGEVTCIIHVNGNPEISPSSTALNFGEVILNDSTLLELTIHNTGCDTLFVDSLKNSLVEFVVNDNTPLEVMPNDSSMINIYFKPSSVTDFSDNLVIYHTDETELSISLTGSGLDAPEMTVTPDTVEITMDCNGLGSTSFTINNAGDGPLNYNIKTTFIDLELISENLDANYTSVLGVIPNRYNFIYDGDDYSIDDGGGDMYDGGNYLSTDIGGDIEYTDEIMESSYLGEKGRYFTRKYDGLFVFAGNLDHVSTFEVYGGLGADGDGLVDATKLTLVHNGTTYYGFVKRVYNAGDPSVNHLFITDNPDVEQEFNTDTDDDYHEVSNLEDVNVLYYLLYSSPSGGYINDSQTLNIMENFLDAIGSSSDESITINPSTGTISSGGSQVVDIDLTLEQINTGIFFTDFVVSSNDPLNSIDTVVLKLTVDGQADISLPSECVDFGKIAVADSIERVVTIKNIGCDTLFVNDIDGSMSQYFVVDSVFELLPYDSVLVSVYFKPDANTIYDADLDIQTSIGDYQLCLTGEGVASFADISVDSASFNVTLECTPYIEAPIEIFNDGEADLNFSISADESFVEFSEESGIVAFNESTSIIVKIVGSELPPGTFYSNITISSNDPDTPDFIILVTLENISGSVTIVTIDPRDSDICLGDILTLNAGFGFADYSWSTSESTRTIDVSETDKYIVTVTDYNGCFSMDSVEITVHNPTINLDPTAEICLGDEITFDAGAGFTSFLWSTSSTEQTITVSTAGTYSVTVTDELTCSNDASVDLTVNSLPVVNLGPDVEITTTESVTLDAGAGFASYNWSNSSTSQTLVVSGATVGAGEHEFSVVVTDGNTCSNSDTILVTVNISEGINSFELANLVNIYPVPAKDFINLNFITDHNENLIIELIDVTGKTIYNNKLDKILANETHQIEISNYSTGIYFIKIYNTEISVIQKVTIQK